MKAIGLGVCATCEALVRIYWPREGMPRVFRHNAARSEFSRCDGSYKEAVAPTRAGGEAILAPRKRGE